ncbi:pectin esterase [Bradyrhizobium sp. WBAH42]|nr:pectin esterase [Bradyrhizobium sp. WBAH30]MDD1547590.1 pectin esterase [Bradyrhizobium sp. WBAH41]MDD1561225.1 pectin esterase [Bradyrhizobium sp. WBAH23]MDD1568706.1 pectin esterase [Bradyrhizobium sp. WBAH33]MDD1594681.1 pectin esterase [Bradyrhizobium sp. WBAH42]NRB92181.1 pectin esterase [Bradyrhizobium sp. WBAH10]QCJ93622.1 pectin esterase [Bradyrhizobium yuanmingense]
MRIFVHPAALLTGCFCMSSAYAQPLLVSHAENAAYHSVQQAIDALPAEGGDVRIAPGIYREKVKISKSGVHLSGTGSKPENTVIVYGDGAINVGGTARSATLDANGDDFRLENLTIQNDYALNPANPPSQAVALSLTGDRDVVTRVRLLGAQDTLLAGKGPNGRMSRQYFSNCYIEGHVDFVFGNAKAWFRKCELHGIANQAVVFTAQSKAAPDEDSGYVFDHCTLSADPAARDIALGRPWRPYATVVFLSTKIDAQVIPEGWREWDRGKTNNLSTSYYAEYRSFGVGANPLGRESYSHQLTDGESAKWSLTAFFAGATDWLPAEPYRWKTKQR